MYIHYIYANMVVLPPIVAYYTRIVRVNKTIMFVAIVTNSTSLREKYSDW